VERNKGRREDRVLRSAPVTSEQVAFPFAAQAARLRRHLQGHSPEEVCLITSVEPARLDAARWLQLNRQAWGIESGLHQRLDVSQNDDRCRVRHSNSMLLFALMRRFANSLLMEWKTQFPNPDHKTTTDFQGYFSADHHRRALRFLTSKHPHLKIPS
jgi:predicted transposase YbfD/YdcC